jgi:hypothetical protein
VHWVKLKGVGFVCGHDFDALLSFIDTTNDNAASGHLLRIYFARQFPCALGLVMLYS